MKKSSIVFLVVWAILLTACQMPSPTVEHLPLTTSPPAHSESAIQPKPAEPSRFGFIPFPQHVEPVPPKPVPHVIRGRIVIDGAFTTQALAADDIKQNATVSLVQSSDLKVRGTTISDASGNFVLEPTVLTDGNYFVDMHKRESAVGSPAIFLRTLLQVSGGTQQSITGADLVISPHTTAVTMAAALNKMSDWGQVLNKVSADGTVFQGDIGTEIPTGKLDKILAKVTATMTGQEDPLGKKFLIVTSMDRTTAMRGNILTIDGLGLDEGAIAELAGASLEIVERNPHQIKIKLPDTADTGDIILKADGQETDPLPIKVGTQLKILEGNYQLFKAGTALKKPMKVQVLDKNGDVVEDVTVSFQITKGTGDLSTVEVTTDSSGEALVTAQLEGTGIKNIQAQLGTTQTETQFRHIGLQVEPGKDQHVFFLNDSLTGQARTKYSGEPLQVLVINDDGTAKAGATVNVNLLNWTTFNSIGDAQNMQFDNSGTSRQLVHGYSKNFVTDVNGVADITDFYLPYSACSCPHQMRVGYNGTNEASYIPVTITAPVKTVDHLQIVSGDNQAVMSGRPFTDKLMVEAIGSDGLPMANVPVTFSFTQGSGKMKYMRTGMGDAETAGPLTLTAGSNGRVYIDLLAPITPQAIKIKAETSNGEGIPVEFTETATLSDTNIMTLISPTQAYSMKTGTSSNGTNWQHLQVKVTDPNGNPVAGETIDFSAKSGCLSSGYAPASAVTDANGLATSVFTTQTFLGASPCYGTTSQAKGTNIFPDTIIFPTIYAVSNPATSMQILIGDNQTVSVGTFSADRLTVKVFDPYGNALNWDSTKVHFELVTPDSGLINTEAVPVDVNLYPSSVASVSFIPLIVGPIKVRATLLGGDGTVLEFTVNGMDN